MKECCDHLGVPIWWLRATVSSHTSIATAAFARAQALPQRKLLYLLAQWAAVVLLLQDGVQPLHMCAEKGHRQVAAVLIAAGASPNVKDTVSAQ